MKLSRKLSSTAKAMISAPNRVSAADHLRTRIPALYEHIRLAKQTRSALRLWGNSLNHDEYADRTIVDPGILEVLTDLTGVPMEGDVLHAGLQHTYGYLFSLIETPYGFKRDRWTNGELDAAFGFASPVLFALPSRGTLLFNVSYFIGRIAFRGCRREADRLRRLRSRVAPALVKFDYRRLRVARLTETISSPANKKVKISFVSDFVRYPRVADKRKAGSANSALLVYSLVDSREPIRKLITAFPISLETVRSLTDPGTLGARQPVKLSYNISVASFNDSQVTGSRRLSRDAWIDDEP